MKKLVYFTVSFVFIFAFVCGILSDLADPNYTKIPLGKVFYDAENSWIEANNLYNGNYYCVYNMRALYVKDGLIIAESTSDSYYGDLIYIYTDDTNHIICGDEMLAKGKIEFFDGAISMSADEVHWVL